MLNRIDISEQDQYVDKPISSDSTHYYKYLPGSLSLMICDRIFYISIFGWKDRICHSIRILPIVQMYKRKKDGQS